MFELAKDQLDVGIVPHHVDAMVAFYRDVLALEPRPSYPVPNGSLVQFRIGEGTLRLYCVTPSPLPASGNSADAIGLRQIVLAMPDFEQATARAAAAGVTVERSGDGDQQVAVMADPDGNEVTILSAAASDGLSMHVGMAVGDLEATRHFFVELLGLGFDHSTLSWGGRARHHIRVGRSVLGLWQADQGAPVHSGPVLARAGIRYLAVGVTNASAVAQALIDKDVSIPIGPLTDDGYTFFIALDPDSNSIEFLSKDG